MSCYTKGLPVWFQIPATSVPRAQDFYTTLFDFRFRTADPTTNVEEPIAHFTYPHPVLGEQLKVGGGIMKVCEGGKIVSNLHKPDAKSVAPLMYFYVDDMEWAMEKTKELGGAVLIGRTKQGEMGEYAVLQDTEGNSVSLIRYGGASLWLLVRPVVSQRDWRRLPLIDMRLRIRINNLVECD